MQRGIRAMRDGYRRPRTRAQWAMEFHREEAEPTRILLAEDDDEMRRMLAEWLRRDGYLVSEARDGIELTERICEALFGEGRAVPDVLITDLRMPGRDGLDVVSLLRGADSTIPVILITAFGGDETHLRAARLGADAVFDKPLDLDELRAAVHRHAPPV